VDGIEYCHILAVVNHVLPTACVCESPIDKNPIKTYYADVENLNYILSLVGLILLAIAVNVPLGYVRQKCRKFSFAWYFYVHISIPVIIYLRIKGGFSWRFIPLTLLGAFAGQFIGGRIQKRRQNGE
jgi:hypothetical protein